MGYSLWDRLFKKEFQNKIRALKEESQSYQEEIKKDHDLLSLLEETKKQIEKTAIESLNNKFEEVNREIKSRIKLKDNGIFLIDDYQSEVMADCLDNDFDSTNFSLKEIALVHATNYFPRAGVIKTAQDSGVLLKREIEVDGQKQSSKAYSHHDTIHFALNGKVYSHPYGIWDDCKYIIIEPLKHHLKIIEAISPEDTWTTGLVKLSKEAIILVEEKEYNEEIKELAKDLNIILYQGESKVCTEKVLLLMGYKPQTVGVHNWEKQTMGSKNYNSSLLKSYIMKNYPKKIGQKHFDSLERYITNNLSIRDLVLSTFRKEPVQTKEGLIIKEEEFWALYKYYEKEQGVLNFNLSEEELFSMFIKDFGVRFKDNNLFLLDDKSIISSYPKDLEEKTVKEIYQFYQETKEKGEIIKSK
ncbi:MAG: hypothetical protein ACOXZR_00265 [Bacilli bacterium]